MVNSLVHSMPELFNVGIIVLLFSIIYGTLGMVLFGGPYLHTRCRLTPFPVNRTWTPGLDPEPYRCLPGPVFSTVQEEPTWMYKSQSPWSVPQYCYWPIDQVDPDNQRLCALDAAGHHKCKPDRWCGSNFDALGNARFYDLPKVTICYNALSTEMIKFHLHLFTLGRKFGNFYQQPLLRLFFV